MSAIKPSLDFSHITKPFVLARRILPLLIAMAGLFLTSCSTNTNQISVSTANSPSAQTAPSGSVKTPPPPYVPYETYSGEAAQVKNVLDSIDAHPHNPAPKYAPSSTPSIYPHETGYPATITVKNETDCQLGFYLQGPSARNFAVKGGTSETLNVAAGSYQFGVDNHLCPGKFPPLLGNDIFAAGGSYTLTLSEQVIQPKTGQFEIHNDTGASLTVKVGGATRTVATGSVSIALPVGSYTADITAKCGTTTESFKITQGETYTGKYWCVGGRVTTENRAVGMGNFVVNNNTGGTLTVSVGGKTHKVPQGTTSINLPEGKYKANIVSRCGSATESLNIEAGSQHEGHYQCVSYRVR